MKRIIRLSGITARTTLLAWTITLATLGTFVAFIVPQEKRDLQVGLESKAQGVAAALQGEVAGAAVSEDYSSVVDHAMQVLSGDKAVDFLVITKNDGYALIVQRDAWRVVPLIDAYWRPQQRQSLGGSSWPRVVRITRNTLVVQQGRSFKCLTASATRLLV